MTLLQSAAPILVDHHRSPGLHARRQQGMPAGPETLVFRAGHGICKLRWNIAAGVIEVRKNRRLQYRLDKRCWVENQRMTTRLARIAAGFRFAVYESNESRCAIVVAEIEGDWHHWCIDSSCSSRRWWIPQRVEEPIILRYAVRIYACGGVCAAEVENGVNPLNARERGLFCSGLPVIFCRHAHRLHGCLDLPCLFYIHVRELHPAACHIRSGNLVGILRPSTNCGRHQNEKY